MFFNSPEERLHKRLGSRVACNTRGLRKGYIATPACDAVTTPLKCEPITAKIMVYLQLITFNPHKCWVRSAWCHYFYTSSDSAFEKHHTKLQASPLPASLFLSGCSDVPSICPERCKPIRMGPTHFLPSTTKQIHWAWYLSCVDGSYGW